MEVGILKWEGSRMELHVVSIEEIFGNMRWLFRIAWEFGIAGHVDTTKGDLSPVFSIVNLSGAMVGIIAASEQDIFTYTSRRRQSNWTDSRSDSFKLEVKPCC